MLRKRRRISDREDQDPLGGLTNLSDVMLVLALAFLIFAIMAVQTNPDIIHTSQEQSQSQGEQVSTGQSINNSSSGGSSENGYSEVGKVYKDPETGKLVMVSSS